MRKNPILWRQVLLLRKRKGFLLFLFLYQRVNEPTWSYPFHFQKESRVNYFRVRLARFVGDSPDSRKKGGFLLTPQRKGFIDKVYIWVSFSGITLVCNTSYWFRNWHTFIDWHKDRWIVILRSQFYLICECLGTSAFVVELASSDSDTAGDTDVAELSCRK